MSKKTPETLPREVKPTELKLGDTVRLDTAKYSDAMVENIANGEITLVRPYMHHGDFSHTGGVLTFIGLEKFKAHMSSGTFLLVARGGPLQ